MRELLARVKANIRRTAMLSAPAAEDSAMSAGGGITINTDSFQVRKTVSLSTSRSASTSF